MEFQDHYSVFKILNVFKDRIYFYALNLINQFNSSFQFGSFLIICSQTSNKDDRNSV